MTTLAIVVLLAGAWLALRLVAAAHGDGLRDTPVARGRCGDTR
ncbi:hypothetical protein [Cellulomonas rhizosphaerae]|nr:hypothetical protein [Cellulomonas rhizosphaerae]